MDSWRLLHIKSVEDVRQLRNRIRCKQVHLVIGNHDKDYSRDSIFQSIQHYKELKTEYGRFILFPITLYLSGMRRIMEQYIFMDIYIPQEIIIHIISARSTLIDFQMGTVQE